MSKYWYLRVLVLDDGSKSGSSLFVKVFEAVRDIEGDIRADACLSRNRFLPETEMSCKGFRLELELNIVTMAYSINLRLMSESREWYR